MAQQPVLTPFMAQLEVTVEASYKRHVDTANTWFAHDFVPFDQGENFAFLGGRDWDSSSVTLPKHITDALEILLIDKDQLPAVHRELVEHFLLEDWWGMLMGRWTAEEHLHAVALRNYLVVTRQVDPVANEMVRVEHMWKGYRADELSQIETLVFMALWERQHAVFCEQLAAQIDDETLRKLISAIGYDEGRHAALFDDLVRACFELEPEETAQAVAGRIAVHPALGTDIDAYTDKVRTVAQAGIYGEDDKNQVVSDAIKAWGMADVAELRQFVR